MTTRTSAAPPAPVPEPAPGPVAETIDVARLRTALLRLSRRLRRHEVADLTPTQLSALATVAAGGPVRLGDLAAAERIAPSTLTRLVAALAERGYVQRSPAPDDARACLLSVTELGTVMLDRVRQETTSLLAENLQRLPPSELATLAAALPTLERLAGASVR